MSEVRPFAEPLNAGTKGASGMLLKKLARAMFYVVPSLTAGQAVVRWLHDRCT